MRGLLVGVLTGVSLLGQVRYARLAEIEGSAGMRPHPAEAWRAALRNAPLVEASSLRTPPGSRLEVELDDGSVLRLAGEADCELSDYTRLSTGQRITHIAVDRGVAYFSGESHWRDALVLAAPGAQITIRRGSRVRLEVNRGSSQVSVIEGDASVATPAVELNVKEGHALRVDPSLPDKFVYAPEFD